MGKTSVTFRRIARAAMCLTCSFALSLAAVPSIALAAPATAAADGAIEELLSRGPYVEGEVIVVGTGEASAPRTADVEELMVVDESALETLLDSREASGEQDPALDAEEGRVVAAGQDTGLSMQVIQDDKLTTRELLKRYMGKPGVVSVEPNYTQVAAQGSSPSKLTASALGSFETAYTVGDISAYQWGMSNDGSSNLTGAKSAGYDIGLKSWKDAQKAGSWSSSGSNSSGTVAICDTGVDFSHPDLQGTCFEGDLSEFGGCAYGINVTDDKNPADVSDRNGHGTQCAGIIAANWDGRGISGVANGAKLISVKMLDDDGTSTSTNVIKAYEYLDSIASAANLKVVNNSWYISGSSVSVELAVDQLGRHGAVSVFSSGNSSLDLDENLSVASSIASPYAVVVNSHGTSGNLSRFSNYGYSGTEFAAPGENILTCVPESLFGSTALSEDGTGLLALESFAKTGDARAFSIVNSDGEEIGSASPVYAYDAVGSAFAVPVSSMDSTVSGTNRISTFQVALDASKSQLGRIAAVGLRSIFAAPYSAKRYNACLVKITGIQTEDASGDVDMHELLDIDAYLGKSSFSSLVNDVGTRYNCWNAETADVASSLAKGERVCLDENGRVVLEVTVVTDVTSGQATPASAQVALDRIALYTSAVPTGAYKYVSGTSFAAPFASGAAAVLAADEPANASMSADQLERTSLERASGLNARVSTAAGLEDTCRTDGRLDLSVPAGKLAPVIESFEVQEGSVSIFGRNFGDSEGGIHVDGRKFEIVEWDDTHVIASVPSWLSNGSQKLVIERTDGRYAHIRIATSSNASGVSLYPSTLELPTTSGKFDTGSADCNAVSTVGIDSSVYLLFADEQGTASRLFKYTSRADGSGDGSWSDCPGTVPDLVVAENALASLGSMPVLTGKFKLSDGGTETRAYAYDAASGMWTRLLSNVVLPTGCTVTGAAGSLYVVGGTLGSTRYGIGRFDSAAASLVDVASLDGGAALTSPVVAVSGKYLYALSNHSTSRMLYRCNLEGKSPVLTPLPGVVDKAGSSSALSYTLAGLADGIALFGSGTAGADTFLLPNDSATSVAYSRCASVYTLNAPLGAYCGYRLYVYGSAAGEDASAFFRSSGLISVSGEGFRNISKAKASIKGQLYTGSRVTPSVTVSFSSGKVKDALVEGQDYTLAFDANTAPGEGSVIITGRGKYYGSTTATFNITLADTSVKSLTLKKGVAKVTWAKAAAWVDGYQVRYSTKKSMAKNSKVTVSGQKTTSATVKKLGSKKRYYFQVRTLCKVDGKVCYSTWSNKKSVKA